VDAPNGLSSGLACRALAPNTRRLRPGAAMPRKTTSAKKSGVFRSIERAQMRVIMRMRHLLLNRPSLVAARAKIRAWIANGSFPHNTDLNVAAAKLLEIEKVQWLQKLWEVSKDMRALVGWSVKPFFELTERERNEGIRRSSEIGRRNQMSPEDVHEAITAATRRPRGHPVEKRLVTTRALEMHVKHPRWKWEKIVSRVCPCLKSAHDVECQRSILRDITRLRAILRRYGVSLPVT
jgi:hypothetical protein